MHTSTLPRLSSHSLLTHDPAQPGPQTEATFRFSSATSFRRGEKPVTPSCEAAPRPQKRRFRETGSGPGRKEAGLPKSGSIKKERWAATRRQVKRAEARCGAFGLAHAGAQPPGEGWGFFGFLPPPIFFRRRIRQSRSCPRSAALPRAAPRGPPLQVCPPTPAASRKRPAAARAAAAPPGLMERPPAARGSGPAPISRHSRGGRYLLRAAAPAEMLYPSLRNARSLRPHLTPPLRATRTVVLKGPLPLVVAHTAPARRLAPGSAARRDENAGGWRREGATPRTSEGRGGAAPLGGRAVLSAPLSAVFARGPPLTVVPPRARGPRRRPPCR